MAPELLAALYGYCHGVLKIKNIAPEQDSNPYHSGTIMLTVKLPRIPGVISLSMHSSLCYPLNHQCSPVQSPPSTPSCLCGFHTSSWCNHPINTFRSMWLPYLFLVKSPYQHLQVYVASIHVPGAITLSTPSGLCGFHTWKVSADHYYFSICYLVEGGISLIANSDLLIIQTELPSTPHLGSM